MPISGGESKRLAGSRRWQQAEQNAILKFCPLKVNVKGDQVDFPGEAKGNVKAGENKRIGRNGSFEVSIALQS